MTNLDFLEQIRMAVDDPEGTDVELLRELAAEHAEAVVEINERLGKIGALLRQGLRSEAIQAAERPPRALDVVAALDAAELDGWRELLGQIGLPAPPRLKLLLAQDIEAAYDEQAGLEGLMRRHRLLALARAPLAERLKVLRMISQKDPGNPAWVQDLDAWQRVRLGQIGHELPDLQRRADRERLLALAAELEHGWTIKEASAMATRVRQAAQGVESAWARQQLKALVPGLNRALAALDPADGTRLRAQWQALLGPARLEPDDALHDEVREALQWLADEDRKLADEQAFEQAKSRLEQGIDQRVGLAALDRLLYDAQRFERELPAPLMQIAARYRGELEGARRRRTRLVAALVLGACLLTAGLAGSALLQRTRRAQVEDGLKRLAALRESRDYSAARRIHEGLPPAVQRHPEIVRLWSDLEREAEAETRRVAEFRRNLDAFREAGNDAPRLDLLEAARGLAIGDSEQREVQAAVLAMETRQQELLADRDRNFRSQLERLARSLADLEEAPSAEEQLGPLQQLDRQFRDLQQSASGGPPVAGRWPKVTPALVQQVGPLRERIAKRLKSMAAREGERAALTRLAGEARSRQAWETGLRSTLPAIVDAGLKSALERSLAEAGIARELEAWNEFAARPEWERLGALGPDEARSLLQKLDAPGLAASRWWLGEKAGRARDHLQAVAAIDAAARKESLVRLRDRFGSTSWNRMHLVVMEEKGSLLRYYCEIPPREDEQKIAWEYRLSLTSVETKSTASLKSLKRVRYHGPAPHNLVSNRVLERLGGDASDYETLMQDLMRIVLQGPPAGKIEGGSGEAEPDPVVLVLMLEAVRAELVQTCPVVGSLPPVQQLERSLAETLAARIDWMAPDNPDARKPREDSARLLQRLRSSVDLDAAARSALEHVNLQADWRKEAGLEWAGFMLTDDGDHQLILTVDPAESLELFVLRPPLDSSRTIVPEPAGSFAAGQWSGCSEALRQAGRPVYCRSTDLARIRNENQ